MTKTPSILRTAFYTLLGLALSVVGLGYSVKTYPGADAFTTFTAALPALTAVASFSMAVVAAAIGILLLLPMLFRLGRRPQMPQPVNFPGTRGDYGVRTAPLRPSAVRYEGDPADPDAQADEQSLADFFPGTTGGYSTSYGDSTPSRRPR